MKRIALLLSVMVAVATFASPVIALEAPIFSLTRLSVGAGSSYDWYSDYSETDESPPFSKEFVIGIYGAYAMTQHTTLVGSSVYGLDNKQIRTSLGIRTVLYNGGK